MLQEFFTHTGPLAPPFNPQDALQSTLSPQLEPKAIFSPICLFPKGTALPVILSYSSRVWPSVSGVQGRSSLLFASSHWAAAITPTFQHVNHEFFFLFPPCLSIAQSCSCVGVVGNWFTICLCLKWGSNAEFSVHLEAQHLQPQSVTYLFEPVFVFSHPGNIHLSSHRFCSLISRHLTSLFSVTYIMTILEYF